MKKTTLATLLLLSITQAYAFNVDDVTRESLLASERLQTIAKQDVQASSQKNIDALKAQFANVKDGDVITIPAGKYPDFGYIEIAANNVTIKAEQPGTAWMTGLLQFDILGDDVTLDGLVFTEGGPSERMGGVRLKGNNNTLQNSTFYYFNDDYAYEPDEARQEYPRYLWLSLWGKEAKVINNRFEGKQKRGTLIGVQKPDDTVDNHTIENNIFLDMQQNQHNELAIKKAVRYNANSWEAIRIGDSKASQYPSNTSFSNNLLINMDGERELISIKSGANTISGNTIFESAAMVSLRHGKATIVENNVILGNEKDLTGGIRIYDEDHIINNNYISNTRGTEGTVEGNADVRGAIVINTGIIDVKNGEKLSQATKGKELNKQWTPKNLQISNNTIIDAQWGIIHGDQAHRVSLFDNNVVEDIYAGDHIHFSNNLVSTGSDDQFAARASEEFALTNATYTNEVYGGQVVHPELITHFSTTVPALQNVNGFQSAENVGADVNKLTVITAEIAGPTYVIK
ncbi:alginate lyase [Vibrio sp. 10N.286.49.B3]|uniref:polysaccharide lyase 6 family protein n=1 Tax=Vibrio sp. 10N.286.49.B3 TaxID=1880855 RepID=UPI000C853F91|nr:polysaccharide lyase 6 family protein [Vibrio sp. 10N.286.49.B3]PMH42621.1 alginate lyase [Vibrio sp. 10N.286.49.B3]